MKILKKGDIIIVILLIMISVVPYGILKAVQNNYSGTTYAVITVEGKLYKRINLLEDKKDTINIKTSNGYNIINIEDGKVWISDADCRDKVCVHEGAIEKVGDKLVCLPHKIIVEIEGDNGSTKGKNDVDIISR